MNEYWSTLHPIPRSRLEIDQPSVTLSNKEIATNTLFPEVDAHNFIGPLIKFNSFRISSLQEKY